MEDLLKEVEKELELYKRIQKKSNWGNFEDGKMDSILILLKAVVAIMKKQNMED